MHPRHPWSFSEGVEKAVELGLITLCLHLYGAIVPVANEAPHAETSRLGFGEETKTNALDIAEDLGS